MSRMLDTHYDISSHQFKMLSLIHFNINTGLNLQVTTMESKDQVYENRLIMLNIRNIVVSLVEVWRVSHGTHLKPMSIVHIRLGHYPPPPPPPHSHLSLIPSKLDWLWITTLYGEVFIENLINVYNHLTYCQPSLVLFANSGSNGG